MQSVGVDDHKVPPNETDQVQPIDRGMGRQIKVYLGQLLDEWLDDEDNLEKWESNKLTASDRRILLAHWFYKASMKALQGEAKRKYFEHALVPCSQPMARTTTSSSWRAPPPATRWGDPAANLVCGAPADYLESTAFGAMMSVPHRTFFVVERIKESFCCNRH